MLNLRGPVGRCCVLSDIVFFNTHFFRLLKALVVGRGAPKITQFPQSIWSQQKIFCFQIPEKCSQSLNTNYIKVLTYRKSYLEKITKKCLISVDKSVSSHFHLYIIKTIMAWNGKRPITRRLAGINVLLPHNGCIHIVSINLLLWSIMKHNY